MDCPLLDEGKDLSLEDATAVLPGGGGAGAEEVQGEGGAGGRAGLAGSGLCQEEWRGRMVEQLWGYHLLNGAASYGSCLINIKCVFTVYLCLERYGG